MSRRKQIKSKALFDAALELERAGDTSGALKGYEKAVKTDPANSHAWNRQFVLYRKERTKLQEVQLIKTAISEYQKSVESWQQDWLAENQEKADSSRELAQVLGMLEPSGLPKADTSIVEKWETRLYLLEYRIKNARKIKTPAKKTKPKTSTTSKVAIPKITGNKPAKPTKATKKKGPKQSQAK